MILNDKIIISEMKISEIITNNPYLLLMLEHFDIKLGVQDKTVKQICYDYSIQESLFLTIANLFNGKKSAGTEGLTSLDVITVINYLVKSHNFYLNEQYPHIKEYIKKIYAVNRNPEMLMVDKFFNDYFIEVKEHLNYENEVVFPYALDLINKNIKQKNKSDSFNVLVYKEHHDDIEEKLADLKNLLIKYLPQENDQQLRRNLLFCLFELELDLNIHSQIEDLILIPLLEKIELQKIRR